MTSHVLLIIASLLVSGELSYGAYPDYIRLDLSPLRGRDVSSDTKAYPRRIPAEPPAEKKAIFCTDRAYPNDIFCDVRTYYESMRENRSSYIHGVVIRYFHPERSDVFCEVHFVNEQAEEDLILSLSYSGFSCIPSLNDTQVPVFQLVDAFELTIEQGGMNNFHENHFRNSGRVTKSTPKGRSVTVIKFEQDLHGVTSHLLFIITSLFMSGELSYGADRGYIRLDLSPLRGKDVPSNTKAYPRRIPVESPAENSVIFCTDSAYPNDIFCDVRSYYKSKWKKSFPDIREVVIEYPHPERSDVACEVHFENEPPEEIPLPRLPYSRFSCSHSFNDTELPVFQLTEAYRLTIKEDIMVGQCWYNFKNDGRVIKSVPKGKRVTVIKFEKENAGCMAEVAIGRPPPEMKCENDGRRCRPLKH